MIHINQIGYRPNDRKLAVIHVKDGKSNLFEVRSAEKETTVLKGKLQDKDGNSDSAKPVLDSLSGDNLMYADFSAITEPGQYYITVAGVGKSQPFAIGADVYKEVKNALLKALYYQRCGTALEASYAGEWSHGSCHLEDGYLYRNQEKHIDVSGGWHDAGDYGKYVSPGAVTVGFMLLGYELMPDRYADTVNIPESGNGIPDVLNEARYELNWLLKMQDTASGGVYHKVTRLNFEDFIMPEEDMMTRYVMDISPTATGDFAAVMAMAARIYQPFDKAFADKALKAAELAWKWLAANPNAPGFTNPGDVITGEYGDSDSRDERAWAAVELYRTTGKTLYHDALHKSWEATAALLTAAPDSKIVDFGWANVSGFAFTSYLTLAPEKRDETLYEALRLQFMKEYHALFAETAATGYHMAMTADDFIWGSSMVAMNHATQLIIADLLEPGEGFGGAAQDLFHYLLGRNPLDLSFVTGIGAASVQKPHHRPSIADGIDAPIPGLVSGGPNKGRQDEVAQQLPADTPPARAFVDDMGSYSTNEIAIYWNAPALFVAAYLDHSH